MSNHPGFPGLEELLRSAQPQVGPGQALQSGIEGFVSGTKLNQRQQELDALAKLRAARQSLEERQFQQSQQEAQQRGSLQERELMLKEGKTQVSKEEADREFRSSTLTRGDIDPKAENPNQRITPAVAKILNPVEKDKKAAKIKDFVFKLAQKQQEAFKFLDNMEAIVAKMPEGTGAKGLAKSIGARTQTALGGFFGGDPDVITYEQAVPTIGRALYKFLSGDVGNISESEGNAATGLVPTLKDAPNVRQAKINLLKGLKSKSDAITTELAKQVQSGVLSVKDFEKAVQERISGLLSQAIADVPGQEKQVSQAALTEQEAPVIKILNRRPTGGQ